MCKEWIIHNLSLYASLKNDIRYLTICLENQE